MRLDGLPAWWDVDVKNLFIPSSCERVLVPQLFPWVLNLHQKRTALPCQCVLMGNAFIFLEAVRACEGSVLMQRDVVWIFTQTKRLRREEPATVAARGAAPSRPERSHCLMMLRDFSLQLGLDAL